MNLFIKTNIIAIITVSLLAVSCSTSETKEESNHEFQNKGHELVYQMVQKVGTYDDLLEKRSVEYTYTYKTPDNKTDISTEKYLFNDELSYGKYKIHERTFPQLKGIIEQGYDGNEFWLKHNKSAISDGKLLKRVAFNRPTNFYWFTMMQKLLDPGLNYEYLGEKIIDSTGYNVVKITFDSTDDQPKDIYQVYINQETSLVDQFLFTVADFGIMENPNIMHVKYEEVDGFLLPTKRQYKKSTWNADITEEPWIYVEWSNIKFNTDIAAIDFKK